METTLANIQRDHPRQMTDASMEASRRDRFYKGLKKSYKESLGYLYDTGAPYEAILRAARKAETEAEHYKDADAAPAKAAQAESSGLWNELASIKAVVSKAWNSQQKNQKQGKQGGAEATRDGKSNKQSKKGPGGPCYGCGGTGHFH